MRLVAQPCFARSVVPTRPSTSRLSRTACSRLTPDPEIRRVNASDVPVDLTTTCDARVTRSRCLGRRGARSSCQHRLLTSRHAEPPCRRNRPHRKQRNQARQPLEAGPLAEIPRLMRLGMIAHEQRIVGRHVEGRVVHRQVASLERRPPELSERGVVRERRLWRHRDADERERDADDTDQPQPDSHGLGGRRPQWGQRESEERQRRRHMTWTVAPAAFPVEIAAVEPEIVERDHDRDAQRDTIGAARAARTTTRAERAQVSATAAAGRGAARIAASRRCPASDK